MNESSWLEKQISIEEAERTHAVVDKSLGSDPVPFGFISEDWNQLKNQFRDGDEIWKYSSPSDTWEHLCGSAGIALVRDGKVIFVVETEIS